MRKPPTPELQTPPPITPAARPELITQQREYELITPLFGGGVEPGYADPVTIVRVPEIRGQLRFWWRATRGGNPRFHGDVRAMKQAEDLIWGASSTHKTPRPSSVRIMLEGASLGQPVRYRDLPPELKYAAFPQQEGNKPVYRGARFTLKISFPRLIEFTGEDGCAQVFDDVEAEVNAALWAWETFGGLGARTRRGFGALCLTSKDGRPVSFAPPAVTQEQARTIITQGLNTHLVQGEWPKDVPHLNTDIFYYRLTGISRSSEEAWKFLLGALKRFRQHRPGFGRSRWPEPDAIRKLTGHWLKANLKAVGHPGHQPDPANSGKFPRAAFGLPIVFHFKDSDEANPWNPDMDPRDVVLRLANYDRLASPLFLRPLCLSTGRFVGVAMILEGTLQPEDFYSTDMDLILTEKDGKTPITSGLSAEMSKPQARLIKDISSGGPLLGDATDPLIAFLDRIQKEDA